MVSLATKLGLRAGQTVRLLHAPAEALHMLADIAPAGVDIATLQPDDQPCDIIFLWPKTTLGLADHFLNLQHLIAPDGALWVVMPKKVYAARHGITFSWEQMQEAALAGDLVDNKIASFSDEEYATRFVIRRERRPKVL